RAPAPAAAARPRDRARSGAARATRRMRRAAGSTPGGAAWAICTLRPAGWLPPPSRVTWSEHAEPLGPPGTFAGPPRRRAGNPVPPGRDADRALLSEPVPRRNELARVSDH